MVPRCGNMIFSEESTVRSLVVLVALFLVGIAGVGFYRGWFQLSTESTDQKPSATITVDKGKIREDEQKAKEKLHGLGKEARQGINGRADKVEEPERRP